MRKVCVLAFFVSISYVSVVMAENAVDQTAAIEKIKALGGNFERSATGKSNSIVTISLVGCTKLKDEDLAFLVAFPDVTELILAGATSISDEGLKQLVRCQELRSLGLARTAVSDEGMKEVAKLKNLERLQLSHTSISDKGIINLGRPSNLQSLVLIGTSVTDDGLKELAEFKNLATVNVKQSRVTDEGLKWLSVACPGLEYELPFSQQSANNNQSDSAALEPQENDTEEQRESLQKIKNLGGSVSRDQNGKVTDIILIGCGQLKDEDLVLVKAFPEIHGLYLGRTPITGGGLVNVSEFKNLQTIGLIGTQVVDESLKHLSKMDQLESIYLANTSITDVGVANLGRLPGLKELLLGSSKVTDEGLKELAEFPNLETVTLQGTDISEEGLARLREARPNLQLDRDGGGGGRMQAAQRANNNQSNSEAIEPNEYDTEEQRESLLKIKSLGGSVERDGTGIVTDIILIGCGQLKDEDLVLVKAFPEIHGLYLGRTPITGDGLKNVSDFKNLQTIGLIGTQVVDESLKHLSKLEQLESIYLANTSITDVGIENLRRLPGLKELLLDSSKVTDEGLKELAEFPNLQNVTLQGTDTSEEGLARLRAARPSLQANRDAGGRGGRMQAPVEFKPMEDDPPELIEAAERINAAGGTLERDHNQQGSPVTDITLIGSEVIEDKDLEFLKLFPDLTFLALGWTKISNQGVKLVPQCTKLTVLGLINTKVDDEGLKEVAKLEHLERLFLSMTSITDEGIVNLGRLPNLQAIMLAGTAITDEGLKELAEFKSLKLVNLSQTSVTEEGTQWLNDTRPDIEIMNQNGGGGGGNGGGGGGGFGGQQGDPDFDTTIARPAYTTSHPRVLFDEAHQNFHTASGRYKAFADMMTNDGYVITPSKKAFTPELLAAHKILVIANASTNSDSTKSAFTSEECQCVKEWINSGGSLLLVTDHEPYASPSADLAKPFGVEMTGRGDWDQENQTGNGLLFSRENLQIGNHPIMTGRNNSERINRILTFSGDSLKGPTDSWQLLRFSETASAVRECQGLALKFGKGRVVVMGEAAELSAQIIGGNPPDRFGMNVPGCDNRQMAINIMHWLSHLTDPDD